MPTRCSECLADADEGAIKKAFRALARELHPDVNRHDPEAEEKFKEAAEAYEILRDSERRALYDRYGHEGLSSSGFSSNFQGFGSFGDIFDAFFGGGDPFGRSPGGAAQGGDVAVAVEITLEQAAAGATVRRSFGWGSTGPSWSRSRSPARRRRRRRAGHITPRPLEPPRHGERLSPLLKPGNCRVDEAGCPIASVSSNSSRSPSSP